MKKKAKTLVETPINLLRALMHVSPELDDYQVVTIFYEEYVRMCMELKAAKKVSENEMHTL